MSGRICCCPAPITGAISISLQLLFGSIGLACSCLLLGRFPLRWGAADEALPLAPRPQNSSVAQNFSAPTLVRWFDAAIQLSSTVYIAFASIWIFTLLLACLTFRYHRPVLVLPDLVICYVGAAMNAVQLGVILIRVLLSPPEERFDDYGDIVLIYSAITFLLVFLANFVFVLLTQRYYSFLVRRHASVSPAAARKVDHLQTTYPVLDTRHVEYREDA